MARRSPALFATADFASQGWRAGPLVMLFREMNQLLDDARRGGTPALGGDEEQVGVIMPRVDVAETDGELRITAEIPGVKEEDIDISLDEDVLTIRAEKRAERRVDRADNHLLERVYGVFQRSFRLPFAADPDHVQAQFDDGVLTVTVRKSQTESQARRIRVQPSSERNVQSSDGEGTPGRSAPGAEADGGDTSRAH